MIEVNTIYNTAITCIKLDRKYIGFELSKDYCEMAQKRVDKENMQLKLNFEEVVR